MTENLNEPATNFKALTFPHIRPASVEPDLERRDAAEHRRLILAAARDLFAAQGVEKVSMHQIARVAGVGQGTLYRRYAHKGLLCTAILNEDIVHFQEGLLAYLEETGESKTALTRLNHILCQLVQFNEANASMLSAIIDATGGERRHTQYQSPFYLWLQQVVILLLHRANERQEIGILDIEYVADLVLLPLSIDFYLYQRQRPGFTPERIAAGLQQFLAHGLSTSR